MTVAAAAAAAPALAGRIDAEWSRVVDGDESIGWDVGRILRMIARALPLPFPFPNPAPLPLPLPDPDPDPDANAGPSHTLPPVRTAAPSPAK